MLTQVALSAPQGVGYGREVARGAELTRQKAHPRRRLIGPLRWTQDFPAEAILLLPLPGYVTPEELRAMIQQRNEDQDDPSWGTVEDLKVQAAESDIGDNTHFMACKSYCILIIFQV